MSRLVITLLLGSLLGSPVLQAADIKLGYIDIDRIRRDGAVFVNAQKRLEKEFGPRQAEIRKRIERHRQLQLALDQGEQTMTESDKKQKERELAKLTQDIQRDQRDLQEEFNQRRNQEYIAADERALKIVQAIGKTEKFDLILQDAVYASTQVDITAKVLKGLEQP
jgi:outer membrane protein